MGRSVKGKRRVQAQSRLRWGKAPPLYALVTGAVALLVGILAARFFAAPFAVETPAAGWRSTSDASFAAKWGNVPCDIDRFGPGELTAERFTAEYLDRKPVIFRAEPTAAYAALVRSVSREALVADFGDVPAAIMSRGLNDGEPDIQEQMPLKTFLDTLDRDPASPKYLFDSETFLGECQRRRGTTPLTGFVEDAGSYPAFVPHFESFAGGGRTFFSVGGDKSGVPFHYHSAAFNIVLAGKKHWTFYGHGGGAALKVNNVTFDPREHHLRWLEDTMPTLSADQRPAQCVQHPGDISYVPPGWYHGTLNVGQTVSIAQQDNRDRGIQKLYRTVITGAPPPRRDTDFDVEALTEVAFKRDDVPIRAEIVNHLGAKHFELQKLDKAEELFSLAVRINPRLGVAYMNICVVFIHQSRPHDCLNRIRAALAAHAYHPGFTDVLRDCKHNARDTDTVKSEADTLLKQIEERKGSLSWIVPARPGEGQQQPEGGEGEGVGEGAAGDGAASRACGPGTAHCQGWDNMACCEVYSSSTNHDDTIRGTCTWDGSRYAATGWCEVHCNNGIWSIIKNNCGEGVGN